MLYHVHHFLLLCRFLRPYDINPLAVEKMFLPFTVKSVIINAYSIREPTLEGFLVSVFHSVRGPTAFGRFFVLNLSSSKYSSAYPATKRMSRQFMRFFIYVRPV